MDLQAKISLEKAIDLSRQHAVETGIAIGEYVGHSYFSDETRKQKIGEYLGFGSYVITFKSVVVNSLDVVEPFIHPPLVRFVVNDQTGETRQFLAL